MIKSVGVVVIYKEKVLLVKQRNSLSSKRTYSIPKGLLERDELYLETAIRETYEETGLLLNEDEVNNKLFILNYCSQKSHKVYKQIFYYVAYIDRDIKSLKTNDQFEIDDVNFFTYEEASNLLFIQQLSILNHLNKKRMLRSEIEWLLNNDIISKQKHPTVDLFIYNYTEKCKAIGYWNETTLWCRGLIMNSNLEIISYPMRKFFEYDQLHPEFRPNVKNLDFSIYKKIDGALGLLYWIENLPFITTRGSFNTSQAYSANLILYEKYTSAFSKLDINLTYYFEIIYPEYVNIIDYGDIRDLILLGAYNNVLKQDIPLESLTYLPFPQVAKLAASSSLSDLLKEDIEDQEGYVIKYDNGFRMKIKFPNFKTKFMEKFR